MKIAVISDIHSNLAALRIAIEFIKSEKVDDVICLGDVVGYGPRPNECVELVRKYARVCLMGNHDHAVLGLTDTYSFNQYARDAVDWTKRNLTAANRAYLENLPFFYEEGKMLFVHSTPVKPEEWHYILSEYEARQYLQKISQSICFVGHSHIPVVFSLKKGSIYKEELILNPEEDKYIVNVGSVGQPRDGDPRLCFVIYDTETHQLRFIRLEYPVEETYKEILEKKLPPFLAMRLKVGQ